MCKDYVRKPGFSLGEIDNGKYFKFHGVHKVNRLQCAASFTREGDVQLGSCSPELLGFSNEKLLYFRRSWLYIDAPVSKFTAVLSMD